MPRTARLTIPRYERSLIALFHDPGVRIKLVSFNAAAEVKIGSRPIRMVIDPFHCGFLQATIHELTHWLHDSKLEPWGALEEPLVEAIEIPIAKHINKMPDKQREWRKAIWRAMR